MDDLKILTARWMNSPWKEAVDVLVDSNSTKEVFLAMVRKLYPDEGSEIRTSYTHRGKAELYDFRCVNLAKRNLENVDFYKFDLSDGDFSKSNISGADFGTAQLENADFSNAQADNSTNFHGCFAKNTDFSSAKFYGVDFSGADFSGANFVNAVLENCDLSNVRLQGAKLDNVKIINCNGQKLQLSKNEQNADWFLQSSFNNVDQIVWIN